MASPLSALVIEENDGHSYLIEEKFRSAFPKAHIGSARSLAEATDLLPRKRWDVVILNSRLPDGKGTDFLNHLSRSQPFVPVALLTDQPGEEAIDETRHQGVIEFLTKDRQTLDSFVARIKKLIDMSQRVRKLLETERPADSDLSFRDPLTLLYSRAYFDESLRREIHRANRYGHEFSILIADVDRFHLLRKKGGAVGDRCLKRLAWVLEQSVRAGDIVARYGHDEFVILLSQCRKADGIRCAGRVLGKIKKDGAESLFTVSIGVMHYRGKQKISRPERILSVAERALQRAKRQGGDCYLVAA